MFSRLTAGAATAIVAVTTVLMAPASAQDWPTRPLRVLAPFTPGGTADILGRLVAQKLSDSLGQNVVVENRTGGAGLVAAEATAKAAPAPMCYECHARHADDDRVFVQFHPILRQARPRSP